MTATGIWLRDRTRFARLSPRRARLALVLAVAFVLACLTAYRAPTPPPIDSAASARGGAAAAQANQRDRADVLLYERVIAGIRSGDPYYAVAARQHRLDGYPLRPFFAMRLPTLARTMAFLPDIASVVLLFAVAGAAVVAWFVRLYPYFRRLPPRIIAALLVVAGLAAFVRPDLVAFHEVWAGPLIALSLAAWRPGQVTTAVAIGLIAMLVRETAALYCGLMALAALIEGRRRELLQWSVALAIFGAVVAAHAWGVAQVVRPLDEASPGWLGLYGFGFFVRTMTLTTGLVELPLWLGAPLLGVAIVGWIGWRDPLGRRVVLTIVGYGLLLGLFCRVDTNYWGLLPSPFILVGLAFAPDAWRDLVTRALDRRRITVTRVAR